MMRLLAAILIRPLPVRRNHAALGDFLTSLVVVAAGLQLAASRQSPWGRQVKPYRAGVEPLRPVGKRYLALLLREGLSRASNP